MTPSQLECAAYNVMDDVLPDARDEDIAAAIADYYIAASKLRYPRAALRFSIFHDVHKSICPVAFDWRSKNTVGIKTKDERRARTWAITAMLLGYAVYRLDPEPRGRQPDGMWVSGGGMGTIGAFRGRQFARHPAAAMAIYQEAHSVNKGR